MIHFVLYFLLQKISEYIYQNPKHMISVLIVCLSQNKGNYKKEAVICANETKPLRTDLKETTENYMNNLKIDLFAFLQKKLTVAYKIFQQMM